MNRVFLFGLCLVCLSCKEEETVGPPPIPVVSVTVSNLPALSPTEGYYQVWATFATFSEQKTPTSLLHDSGFVSLGEFNVGSDGSSLFDPNSGGPASFAIPPGKDPQLIDDVIIAVQAPEVGFAKSLHDEPGSPLIGARFGGTERMAVADLTTSYLDAFGTNFASVSGAYTVTAPTSVPADSNSGVWFYESLPSPSASLRNLVDLKGVWVYEGWVVDKADTTNVQYYSTGKFTRADSADFDGAGTGSGPGAGLNFPGQDFIAGIPARPNLLDARYAIRITVEPLPDNSPMPFFLTLLSTDIPDLVEAQEFTYDANAMQNVIVHSLPTARVTVAR